MKKSLKKVFAALLAVGMLLSLTACGGGSTTPKQTNGTESAEEEYPEMKIEFGTVANMGDETGPWTQGCLALKEFIETESGGKITFNITDNGLLGDDAAMTEACEMGTLQMCANYSGSFYPYSKEFQALSLPYLFDSADQALAVMEAIEDDLADCLVGTGVKYMGSNYGGSRMMTNSKHPIETIDDMKGLKMRVIDSATHIDLFNALGATATPMSFTELFTALQNGTVDGQDNDPSTIYSAQFYEAQKYGSITNHMHGFGTLCASEDWYNGLNEKTKALIDEGAALYNKTIQDGVLEMTDTFIQLLKDNGMEINEVTPEAMEAFRAAAQPVIDKYGAECTSMREKIEAAKAAK